MLDYFDIINKPIKFSMRASDDGTEYAFTKGETISFGSMSTTIYEVVSDSTKMSTSSNLLKMVTLSHEVIHAHMFLQLEISGYIYFDTNGHPKFSNALSCNGFQIIPNVNLNTFSLKERWKYLLCEFMINNPNSNQLSHNLFNTANFEFGESYRQKLETLLYEKHDWNGEPQPLKNLMLQWYGNNWKEKIAKYMSWYGLHETPQFNDWLNLEGITFSDWDNVIGPYKNIGWIQTNDVNHNCN